MNECPELKDLARYVETGDGDAPLLAHLKRCDACAAAVENLEDEVMSLQISISELWFREEISCVDEKIIRDFAAGGLAKDYRRYVEFHLQDLNCPRCQAAVGMFESESTEEGRRRVTKSKARIEDASVKLLGDLRKTAKK